MNSYGLRSPRRSGPAGLFVFGGWGYPHGSSVTRARGAREGPWPVPATKPGGQQPHVIALVEGVGGPRARVLLGRAHLVESGAAVSID
jgi:hypothetical protein